MKKTAFLLSPLFGLEKSGKRAPKELIGRKTTFEFNCMFRELIGVQMEVGFRLEGFYEDNCVEIDSGPFAKLIKMFFATRAVKPK